LSVGVIEMHKVAFQYPAEVSYYVEDLEDGADVDESICMEEQKENPGEIRNLCSLLSLTASEKTSSWEEVRSSFKNS
jgi:hypothetical protein